MTNIQYITDENKVEHVVIDNGNDTFTSMPKSVHDAQVEHLTEITTPDEA